MKSIIGLLLLAAILLSSILPVAASDSLAKGFVSPPDSARPWVYWFWLNGNITREGITADLEAMKRVGIGGVLIMEVDQGAPLGPVDFMGAQWRELFKHVVFEAKRLGLEVNMNNDAGWNGSGGPWIKPEQSMQKVVWTEITLDGPQRFEGSLAQPEAKAGFYRDISVLAFPDSGAYRIPNIQHKAGGWGGPNSPGTPGSAADAGSVTAVARDDIVDLTGEMDATGRLTWDVPQGKWTVIRFGHTTTGMTNSPAPTSGRGLECDKLSKGGAEANFDGMMAKLVADSGPAGRGALVATHVDSWENGSQNWTARMREEFQSRRGYDMLPFLPVITGRVVGSPEISERFLWDLRRTISEMVVEYYAGHIRDLAHAGGLRFTIEAYGSPCDNIPYGGMADEPMGEFWDPGGAMETCRGMASAAHVYGKPIVGAEAFTAGGQERWLQHPAALKALGDEAFCEGINRFVFHRYAMQPWVDDRSPGMTMGPWGQHYERTQTWWEQTKPWHQYLSRCQYMLRQGLFVADICYLQPEDSPQGLHLYNPKGYDWDQCGPEVILERMSVKDGRIVLPDGMSYRVLVLPDSRTMTPRLLRKIRELITAGAVVIGPRPEKSPSLTDYPKCDDEVKQLADQLWGAASAAQGETHVGSGRVVWGKSPEDVLADSGVVPDFACKQHLRYIHRRTSDGTDIYFVSNPRPYAVDAVAAFRVSAKTPELWQPETGAIERATTFDEKNGVTNVFLQLGPSGSVFVVFRKPSRSDPVLSVARMDESLISLIPRPAPKIVVLQARYGILDDPARTRDVRGRVESKVQAGDTIFRVSDMAAGDDPAYGIVKTLVLDLTIDGKPVTLTGADPDSIDMTCSPSRTLAACELIGSDARTKLLARESGTYSVMHASGAKREITVPDLPAPLTISGPWDVGFPPDRGVPQHITLDKLISLSDHSSAGVRHFSGTATYRATFDAPKSFFASGRTATLDLGDVRVIAQAKLNGEDLGVLWKPPFVADVTRALKPGTNEIEIKVTNLWVNRMIGDEFLPEDSDRNPNGTLKSWPAWLADGKPSPSGRYTFTSWRMWGRGDALPKSGLIGPVTISAAHVCAIE